MARAATSKPAGDVVKTTSSKTAEVAKDLFAAFNCIKPILGIYQKKIKRGEAPDLFMVGEAGAIALPLGSEQAKKIVNAAHEGNYNLNDEDPLSLAKEPACVFNEGSFEINNPPWEGYVQELADAAAEGLGLDEGEQVTAALDSLWLWTKDCIRGTPSATVRHGGDRRTWTGKMLILLPSTHEGGEITYNKYGNKEDLSYRTSGYRESMICWHKDIQHLDFKPPTNGQRLGLLYDLHTPKPIPYTTLRSNHHKAVQALQNAIEKYTVLVGKGSIIDCAFFLPLKINMPEEPRITSVTRDKLAPSDLAKIECFDNEGMEEFRGFQTNLAIVSLSAMQQALYPRVLGVLGEATLSGTEYLLTHIMDTDVGNVNLAQSVTNLSQRKFTKDSVLDEQAFASGVRRVVTQKGQIEKHVLIKRALCLLIHLERRE